MIAHNSDRSHWMWAAVLAVTCGLGLAHPATAQDMDWAARFYGEVIPWVSGDAGSGGGEPEYDDAFDLSIGGGLELEYSLHPRWSLLAGAALENYSGDSFQGIEFDSWHIMPLYAGVRFHLTPDSDGWDPYLRLDVGAARLSDVDISFGGVEDTYWDSSWSFLGDVGVGVEYPVKDFSFFVEVKARYIDGPDDAFGAISEADELWSMPVVFGVSIRF